VAAAQELPAGNVHRGAAGACGAGGRVAGRTVGFGRHMQTPDAQRGLPGGASGAEGRGRGSGRHARGRLWLRGLLRRAPLPPKLPTQRPLAPLPPPPSPGLLPTPLPHLTLNTASRALNPDPTPVSYPTVTPPLTSPPPPTPPTPAHRVDPPRPARVQVPLGPVRRLLHLALRGHLRLDVRRLVVPRPCNLAERGGPRRRGAHAAQPRRAGDGVEEQAARAGDGVGHILRGGGESERDRQAAGRREGARPAIKPLEPQPPGVASRRRASEPKGPSGSQQHPPLLHLLTPACAPACTWPLPPTAAARPPVPVPHQRDRVRRARH
jgi:hypothetical protein